MFLIVMVVGLVGLAVMALPAFSRHGGAAGQLGHGGHATHAGHAALHAGHVAKLAAGHAGATTTTAATASAPLAKADGGALAAESPAGLTRFLPSPRLIFSVLALYGAFANALERAAHLSPVVAALVAIVPALAVERFLVTPLWNLVFRLEAAPTAPLDVLILAEARAVTPFRNGRGIVEVVRDGRAVQLRAQLVDKQAGLEVRVGDRLRVEEVDAQRERLTVSVAEA
jgi:hypothetical protein